MKIQISILSFMVFAMLKMSSLHSPVERSFENRTAYSGFDLKESGHQNDQSLLNDGTLPFCWYVIEVVLFPLNFSL